MENQEVIRKIKDLDKKYEKYLTKHGSMLIFQEKMINGLAKKINEINKLLAPEIVSKSKIGFRKKK